MSVVSDVFWGASVTEMKQGYIEKESCYMCLLCGETVEKGIIYQENGILYEAEKYASIHVKKQHGSVFTFLLEMDKEITGLSEHQKNMLKLFYDGKSDKEIQQEMSIGSLSTIRNHRLTLKRKEKQAKAFLTIMELLKENDGNSSFDVKPRKESIMGNEQVRQKYFEEEGTRLKTFRMKQKDKLVVLEEIVKHFQAGKEYGEKEIDITLKEIYEDHTAVRRALVDYGFLERVADGSKYWVKDTNKQEKKSKKELKLEAKEIKTVAGVYQIKNMKNGKVFVESIPNLKAIEGKKFTLKYDGFMNKELQKDWNTYGEDSFVFEVLEELDEEKVNVTNKKKQLKELEEKWLEKLQPYGENGYHKKKKENI